MRHEIGLLLEGHPIFRGMKDAHLQSIAACALTAQFEPGRMIFKEGGEANYFFMIRHGRVALEIYVPETGPVTIETLGEGDVLGWSWLVPPYRWHFDARAEELTRVITLDGRCLRAKFEQDPALGYDMYKRFSVLMADRLQATRLQLLDVYGMKP